LDLLNAWAFDHLPVDAILWLLLALALTGELCSVSMGVALTGEVCS
jgi:hypothetical protein